MFAITHKRGFHMTFANNITLSVQFGPGNYCENKNEDFGMPDRVDNLECKTAEVALWGPGGEWITSKVFEKAGLVGYDDGSVAGWITPDQVAQVIAAVVTMPMMATVESKTEDISNQKQLN